MMRMRKQTMTEVMEASESCDVQIRIFGSSLDRLLPVARVCFNIAGVSLILRDATHARFPATSSLRGIYGLVDLR